MKQLGDWPIAKRLVLLIPLVGVAIFATLGFWRLKGALPDPTNPPSTSSSESPLPLSRLVPHKDRPVSPAIDAQPRPLLASGALPDGTVVEVREGDPPVDPSVPTLILYLGENGATWRAPQTDEEIQKLLEAARAHEEPEKRAIAIASLSARLGHRDAASAWWAGSTYDTTVVKLAMELARDPLPEVRGAATALLTMSISSEAWQVAEAATLADPDPNVRIAGIAEWKLYSEDDQSMRRTLRRQWDAGSAKASSGPATPDEDFEAFFVARRDRAVDLLATIAKSDATPAVRQFAASR